MVGFGCFHPWKLGLGLENVGFLPTCGTKVSKKKTSLKQPVRQ